MNPADQIAADLERLATAKTLSTQQRQELAQRVQRMRAAESEVAKNAAAKTQKQLRRGIAQQVEAAREVFKGDVPLELEEALREIVRLVG